MTISSAEVRVRVRWAWCSFCHMHPPAAAVNLGRPNTPMASIRRWYIPPQTKSCAPGAKRSELFRRLGHNTMAGEFRESVTACLSAALQACRRSMGHDVINACEFDMFPAMTQPKAAQYSGRHRCRSAVAARSLVDVYRRLIRIYTWPCMAMGFTVLVREQSVCRRQHN